MRDDVPVVEGYIPFSGYQTWYRVAGDREAQGRLPVLCLHGGPGATWHHMEPYQELAEGRRVICYDQLGCGNSAVSEPHDPAMWTTELYLAEVAAVREHLGLDSCHVLGHSWGAMLGEIGAIDVPTLLFCGEFDEVTPATVRQAHEAIRGSAFVVLDECSHNSQAERPDLVLGMMRGWLAGVEASGRA